MPCKLQHFWALLDNFLLFLGRNSAYFCCFDLYSISAEYTVFLTPVSNFLLTGPIGQNGFFSLSESWMWSYIITYSKYIGSTPQKVSIQLAGEKSWMLASKRTDNLGIYAYYLADMSTICICSDKSAETQCSIYNI